MSAEDDPALAILIPFLESEEGFEAGPYKDVSGVWTEGFGFVYLPDGSKVRPSTPPMNRPDAQIVLRNLLATKFVPAVRAMIGVPVSNHQVAALSSFAYNEGLASLAKSTLVRDLNNGSFEGAEGQFALWDIAGGHVVGGLKARRQAELRMFLTPDEGAAPVLAASDPEDDADRLMDQFD